MGPKPLGVLRRDGAEQLGTGVDVEDLVFCPVDGLGSELAVVRPVLSERAMTARPAWLGEECAAEITEALGSFDAVGGVAIDATTKPPSTIEWE